MRQLTAVVTMVVVAFLGFVGVGNAQTPQVQVQGVIQSVNCQAQQLTLGTSNGATTLQAVQQTGVYVNGAPTTLCALQSAVGSQATASVVPSDNQFILGLINVTAGGAAQPAAAVNTPSIGTLAIGALVVGGLAYLLLHNGSAGAQASDSPAPTYNNWDDAHQAWAGHCYASPDGNGRWSPYGNWTNWCQRNLQYQTPQQGPQNDPNESKQSA